MNNIASNDDDDDNILSQFLAFTGSAVDDTNVARQYLEMSGNHLETAVSLFLEVNNDNNADAGSRGREGREEEERRGEEEEEENEFHLLNSSVASGGGAGDNTNCLTDDTDTFSEPDYDYLVADDVDDDNGEESDGSDMASTPDYDHLGISCDEELISAALLFHDDNHGGGENVIGIEQNKEDDNVSMVASSNKELKPIDTKGTGDDDYLYYAEGEEDVGEEYILGTLMVRVLQAKNLKSNPHNQGGGITSLLSNHRRFRHQRSTMSPASGGNLTPSSYYTNHHQQLFAKLSYKDNQSQSTSMATEHANGDYHWSRGDQSYFDVTCPSFPLTIAKMQQQQQPLSKAKQTSSPAVLASTTPSPKKDTASCEKPKNIQQPKQPRNSSRRPPPPILQFSLYSKKSASGEITSPKKNKWHSFLTNNDDDVSKKENDDYLLGKCSINILRILSGKTPYFDEWCTLHNDDTNNLQQTNSHDDLAGRVRIVIEYEPTDPPPRPGDKCVFANVYPLVDELYPIPLHSIRNTTTVHRSLERSSMSTSTLSSSASSSTHTPSSSSLTRRPKSYRVEEVVGDHVVLSYQTPIENWQCTFEVHRYLLLCVKRHQACVEKYRERVLDLCDNISQSPAMDVLTRTVETLPDEGLVYVGAELVGGGVGLLGRWWEVGVEGLVEDVVDGINLDGRYSHLEEDTDNEEGGTAVHSPLPGQFTNLTDASQDDRKALPGMPCCPITSLAMIEPVVAADGHTYERQAIARWLQTSDRSPLTGEVLAQFELVPNYLLLSSLGNEVVEREEDV